MKSQALPDFADRDSLAESDVYRDLIQRRDVRNLVQGFFGWTPTAKQQEIIRTIAFHEVDELICVAPTRYGKTMSIAGGIALRFALSANTTVNEIAPITSQTGNFRKYLLEASMKCDLIKLADTRGTDLEQLMNEANRYHLDFVDGNEINFLTAGGADDAKGQMGEGADIVVIDESDDVPDAVYNKRIFRQSEESADKDWSMEIHIGNPWTKTGHFYDLWNEFEQVPNGRRIHVKLEHALREGRITYKKAGKALDRLPPKRFKVLYDAEFPDELQDSLMSHRWIEQAEQRRFDWGDMADTPQDLVDGITVGYGFDIAGEGSDNIVLIRVENFQDKWRATHCWDRARSNDTGQTAKWGMSKIEQVDNLDDIRTVVDANGIGQGVVSKFREEGINVIPFKAGDGPTREKARFLNKKAQYYWRLRDILEAGDMDLMPDAPKDLYVQLTQLGTDRTRRDKAKVMDPDSGSPDFADALMMSLAMKSGITIGTIGGGG